MWFSWSIGLWSLTMYSELSSKFTLSIEPTEANHDACCRWNSFSKIYRSENFHFSSSCFWHDEDEATITSPLETLHCLSYIWNRIIIFCRKEVVIVKDVEIVKLTNGTLLDFRSGENKRQQMANSVLRKLNNFPFAHFSAQLSFMLRAVVESDRIGKEPL